MKKLLVVCMILACGFVFGVASSAGYLHHIGVIGSMYIQANTDDTVVTLGKRWGGINLRKLISEDISWKHHRTRGPRHSYYGRYKNNGRQLAIVVSRYPSLVPVFKRLLGDIVFSKSIGESKVFTYKIELINTKDNNFIFSVEYHEFEGKDALALQDRFAFFQKNNTPFAKELYMLLDDSLRIDTTN